MFNFIITKENLLSIGKFILQSGVTFYIMYNQFTIVKELKLELIELKTLLNFNLSEMKNQVNTNAADLNSVLHNLHLKGQEKSILFSKKISQGSTTIDAANGNSFYGVSLDMTTIVGGAF